jgi:hypothetical protein
MPLAGALRGRRRLVKPLKLAEHYSVETKKRSEERFSYTQSTIRNLPSELLESW